MVIFDICGTLYDSNTTMDFCEYRAKGFKKKVLKLSKSVLGKAANKVSLRIFGYDFIRILHVKDLKGVECLVLEEEAKSFVRCYLVNKKIGKVHEYLERFDKKDVVLVSATIEPVAKAIANELGGLDYCSTTLENYAGICSGVIRNDLLGCKHELFKSESICFVVTDNKSDLKLCQRAGAVVVVSKDKDVAFWRAQQLNINEVLRIN